MRTLATSILGMSLLLASIGLTLACASQQDTLIASSAHQATYAARYPDALDAAVKVFDEREAEANAVMSEMPNFSRALQDPNWHQVLEIYESALTAGKTQAYADRIREVRYVRTFFEEEKNELNRRAGGAAQHAAQQGGCNVQVGGAVGLALGKAVDKQLEERLRERNEAHLLIVRYSESLGSKNTETISKQADLLSYASFIVHIELIEAKGRVEAMVKEAEDVAKTADDFIANEEDFQKQPNRTAKEKEDSVSRIKFMKDAKNKVAASAEKAKAKAEKLQERIDKVKKDFDYIEGAMRSEVSQRAS